jgi:hypothetical protein
MSGVVLLFPLYAFMAWTGLILPSYLTTACFPSMSITLKVNANSALPPASYVKFAFIFPQEPDISSSKQPAFSSLDLYSLFIPFS